MKRGERPEMIPDDVLLVIGKNCRVLDLVVHPWDSEGYWEQRFVANMDHKYEVKECPQCKLKMIVRYRMPNPNSDTVEIAQIVCPGCRNYMVAMPGPAEIKDVF